MSLLWILSELVVDWPPKDQHCADPLCAGCRSSMSWLLINPPRDQHFVQILSGLAADPLWVGCWLIPPWSKHCRSSRSWLQILSELVVQSTPLRINTPDPLFELVVDPLWVGCRLTPPIKTLQILSWLARDPLQVVCWSVPPRINTMQILFELAADPLLSWLQILSELVVNRPPPHRVKTVQILSELVVDPLWVGCRLTPLIKTLYRSSLGWLGILSELFVDWRSPPGLTLYADPLWVGCRSSLSWLSIDPPPRSTLCICSLSWLRILSELVVDGPPSPPLPYRFQLSELAVDRPPPPPTDFNFLIFNILIYIKIIHGVNNFECSMLPNLRKN